MSLQVWLPLNGNFNNQGAYGNINFTQTGTISNVDGKIGQCKSFSSSNVIAPYTYTLGNSFSICLWVNWTTFPASDSNDWIIHLGKTSGYANAVAGLSCYHSTLITVMAGGKNDSSYTHGFTTGTWHHIAFTWRSSGSSYLYVDGELVKTYTNLTGGTVTAADKLSLGSNVVNSSTKFKGKLNDVRFYTNFLSAEEVKEISKGLVLHFPLSNRYIENTTNLINTEDCLSATCYNGAISKYGYGDNTNIYKTVGTFQGRKCTKVYNQTSGTGMYPYVYISNMYTSNGTNAPEYKTLSFDYYTTISTSITPYKLGSGSGTATYTVTNTEVKTGTGTNSVTIPVKQNMWNHVEVTFHGTTDADAQWGYIQNNPSHTANTSNYWLFANMQLESKDHATGYAEVNSTRTATVVKDTSGFVYNGTLNSTFTINSSTPKYNVSTKFTGTNYISLTSPTAEAKTLSIWVKWDTIPSGQSVVFLDYKSKLGLGLMSTGILCGTSGPGNFYTFSKSSLVANTWYHFVVVNTGAVTGTSRDLYINGVKQTQTSSTSNWSYSVDQTQIGKRNSTSDGFVGLLSDVRLYATALTANDVLSLYNNGAYIDSAGNIHGKIR